MPQEHLPVAPAAASPSAPAPRPPTSIDADTAPAPKSQDSAPWSTKPTGTGVTMGSRSHPKTIFGVSRGIKFREKRSISMMGGRSVPCQPPSIPTACRPGTSQSRSCHLLVATAATSTVSPWCPPWRRGSRPVLNVTVTSVRGSQRPRRSALAGALAHGQGRGGGTGRALLTPPRPLPTYG